MRFFVKGFALPELKNLGFSRRSAPDSKLECWTFCWKRPASPNLSFQNQGASGVEIKRYLLFLWPPEARGGRGGRAERSGAGRRCRRAPTAARETENTLFTFEPRPPLPDSHAQGQGAGLKKTTPSLKRSPRFSSQPHHSGRPSSPQSPPLAVSRGAPDPDF